MSTSTSVSHPRFGPGSKLITVTGGPVRGQESYWVMSVHPSLCFSIPSQARAEELLAEWRNAYENVADSYAGGQSGDIVPTTGVNSLWASLLDKLENGQLKSDEPHLYSAVRDNEPVYDSQGNGNFPMSILRGLSSSCDTDMPDKVTIFFYHHDLPTQTRITVGDLTESALEAVVGKVRESRQSTLQQADDQAVPDYVETWIRGAD